jgi:hypothetical protein
VLLALVLFGVSKPALSQSTLTLTPGKVISRSATVFTKGYNLGTTGPLKISGHDLVVDFNGATVQGARADADPDTRTGTGVEVSGTNITIKNLRVRGYKVGLLAKNSPGLHLLGCDFSYNYKQHLKSTPKREDESDWMSYHQNEHDEWLEYGAGVYLSGCDHFEVSRCRATGGECGLMLNRSNHGQVIGNDFSYLSGIGLGLYRSSDNLIQQNKIDYCVRGYSYGVYYRGQDSAGILVYEQSSRNVFAYNSVTHGGDGFFLWAGQSTMDTGQGGCNDNVVCGNDFSHAPTNGIEATFSRNTFINNLVAQCWHGVWGGYSFDTLIDGNTFIGDLSGVAIEHGQNNAILGNAFIHNRIDLELWANRETDPSWGYPKHRDTSSHTYALMSNLFLPSFASPNVDIRNTRDVTWDTNWGTALMTGASPQQAPQLAPHLIATTSQGHPQPLWGQGPEFESDLTKYPEFTRWSPHAGSVMMSANRHIHSPAIRRDIPLPFIPFGEPRGRKTIIVDEWGPYDYRSPKLVLDSIKDGVRTFRILGPKKSAGFEGHWKVKSIKNGELLSAISGKTPATIQVRTTGTGAYPFSLTLDYQGPKTSDYRGLLHPAGESLPVIYQQFVTSLHWKVAFFKWDKSTDPRTDPEAFERLLNGTPLAQSEVDEIAYGAGRTWDPGVPADYFAIKAETSAAFKEGVYDLEITSDDGARLFMDGKLVQLLDADNKPANAFKYQGATTYHVTLKLDGQPHDLKLEYFQIDGGKALDLSVKPHSAN